jgi:hypothetical protein
LQHHSPTQKVQYVLLLARREAVEVRDHLTAFAAVCQDCLQQVIGAAAVRKKYLAFLRNNGSADIAQEHVTLPSERSAYEVALRPEPHDG